MLMSDDAFAEAQKPNGKHHGFYQQYKDEPSSFIRRGIRSLQRQIVEHEYKLGDPENRVVGFKDLDPRRKRALVERVWHDELVNYREQIEILEGILAQRRP
jgi:hypothetical protein